MKNIYKKLGIIFLLIDMIIISCILATPIKSNDTPGSISGDGGDITLSNDRQKCVVPAFLKSNTDFFDKKTGSVRVKQLKRLLRKLELQMNIRYGKDEVKSGLMNLSEAKFKFDDFDLIYFSIKAYLICEEHNLF